MNLITKRTLSCISASILCFACAVAQNFEQTQHGIKALANGQNVELQLYTPSSIRVTKSPADAPSSPKSFSVIASPEKVEFTAKKSGNNVVLSSKELTAILNLTTGTVSFRNNKGRLLSEGTAASFTPVDDAGEPALKVKQTFVLDKDEPVYGLGNLENGKLSQRGVNRTLMPGNIEDGIPLIVSPKGYAVFWDNYSPTEFIDNDNETAFESAVGECVDYYFMEGKNADEVISEIRTLTGDVPMFPLWTYGFWQSRERYKSQGETVGVVKKYRELGVPLDGIIQDWQYWGNNYLWNAMEFMNPEFNNPQKMMDDIHGLNAHAIISIWSSFGPQTKPYRDLDEKGLLFNFSTWPQSGIAEQWPPRRDYPSGVRVYDAYSPEARDIYWKHLSRLHDYDMDGWWMDSTEPDHLDFKPEDLDTKTYLGSFRKVRNAYPLLTVGGVYDHQRAKTDDKRVFILTRSGYVGQQRYGCNVWTGDVNSTWDMLRKQIPALLNFTLTGNPNCNSDIGGFFCSGYNLRNGDNSATKNPLFQELFVRWMQFGTFTPMMRSHGADIMREIYYFGQKGDVIYDAIEDAIRLRYSLLPYIYSTSWQVSNDDKSFMRALMMDFPNDKKGWNIGDQYMFGDNLLVAPVVNAQYTPEKVMKIDENTGWNRDQAGSSENTKGNVNFMEQHSTDVYLPAGASWYDYWTNERYKGGQTISKPTTIKTIPLYVKAGSIMPMGPDVQYATEKPWDNLTVRVYPGANGEFTLYEDEFDNYNYEKGQYSTIKFIWNDKSRTLTIDDRKGTYPGMLKNRNFNVVLMSNGGSASPVTVPYDGSKKSVKL